MFKHCFERFGCKSPEFRFALFHSLFGRKQDNIPVLGNYFDLFHQKAEEQEEQAKFRFADLSFYLSDKLDFFNLCLLDDFG